MNVATPFACATNALPRVEEAIALVRQHFASVTASEDLALHKALGRVLARDAAARVSMPPCDRSAMDGFAFRWGHGGALRLAGRALAGKPFQGTVETGECIAIATGASLPQGCDTVAIREQCRETLAGVAVLAQPHANIRRRGEDFHAGDRLVAAGTRLDARHIGLLASGGLTQIGVKRRLRIAVLSIGDELRPGAPDGICDANRVMLLAQCESLGANVSDLGILPDRRDIIADVLAGAASAHDVIIASAGTSAGDEDHMRGAILDCGGEILLAGVAIKPGKPVSFGRAGQALVMALPGNPAAALITFAVLGLPLLRHLGGACERQPPWQIVRAAFAHHGKAGMHEYLRVTIRPGADGIFEAVKSTKDGSAMLSSLAASDGLVCLDDAKADIVPGTLVPFQSFAGLLAP